MHIAQNWRIRNARYAMEAVRCDRCGAVLFPARAICPHCVAADQISRSTQTAQVDHQTNVAESFTSAEPHWSQAAR